MVRSTNFSQVPGVSYGTMCEDIQRILAWFPISPGLVTNIFFLNEVKICYQCLCIGWRLCISWKSECQFRLKWLNFFSQMWDSIVCRKSWDNQDPSVKTSGTRLAPKVFRVGRYKNCITLHLALYMYIKLKSLIHGTTDYGRAWVNSKNYCFSGSKDVPLNLYRAVVVRSTG